MNPQAAPLLADDGNDFGQYNMRHDRMGDTLDSEATTPPSSELVSEPPVPIIPIALANDNNQNLGVSQGLRPSNASINASSIQVFRCFVCSKCHFFFIFFGVFLFLFFFCFFLRVFATFFFFFANHFCTMCFFDFFSFFVMFLTCQTTFSFTSFHSTFVCLFVCMISIF